MAITTSSPTTPIWITSTSPTGRLVKGACPLWMRPFPFSGCVACSSAVNPGFPVRASSLGGVLRWMPKWHLMATEEVHAFWQDSLDFCPRDQLLNSGSGVDVNCAKSYECVRVSASHKPGAEPSSCVPEPRSLPNSEQPGAGSATAHACDCAARKSGTACESASGCDADSARQWRTHKRCPIAGHRTRTSHRPGTGCQRSGKHVRVQEAGGRGGARRHRVGRSAAFGSLPRSKCVHRV